MRGASVFLIALLESGDLDYAFEYDPSSASMGWKCSRCQMLSTWAVRNWADFYGQVEVERDFQRFATVKHNSLANPIHMRLPSPCIANTPGSSYHCLFVIARRVRQS